MLYPDMYSPPTDSLYKFCAISGTIILAVSIYYPESLRREVRRYRIEVKAELKALQVDLDSADDNIKEQELIIKEALAAANKGESTMSVSAVRALTRELKEATAQLKKSSIQSLAKGEKLTLLNDELITIDALAATTFGLGFAMALLGFIFWYALVQRYQDKKIKADATATTPESETTTPPKS